jgi:putative FmdB family regulatory protein
LPLLKFKCESCGQVFEDLVTSDVLPLCPKCGSDCIKRHYQGKCYFGMNAKGSSAGGSCACGGTCNTCQGCH